MSARRKPSPLNAPSSGRRLKGEGLWQDWMRRRKGKPFSFQEDTWKAFAHGESGLVHAPTGFGKTYAVWGGPLQQWLRENPDPSAWGKDAVPMRVLWITPLRALANDSLKSLQLPIEELGIPWRVEMRTGDTTSAVRQRQRKQFPTALVTTPESLSVLLSYEDTRAKMETLTAVIVDEWHQLLGSKRGVQAELCLARLREWFPALQVWGLSATLGNLDEAMHVLIGKEDDPNARFISAKEKKKFVLKTLIPEKQEFFPLSGHSGLHQVPKVVAALEKKKTTLLFTNTRSQTELWFQALAQARPDWVDQLAIHHGSLDRAEREIVEDRLRRGDVRCVVCTASLDLGVDFSPVEQVIQVGGPKGIARLLQRAGRSGHEPGGTSTVLGVPAHAMELVEFTAAREAAEAGLLEHQTPLDKPLDVLIQHVVTLAIGGGFQPDALFRGVRRSYAYRNLTEQEWEWVLEFVSKGGKALQVYPQFQRVSQDEDKWRVIQPDVIRFHRLSIGTITSESVVTISLMSGRYLGTMEEDFIAKLRPGDGFTFGGRHLEFIRLRDMKATVRISNKPTRNISRWMGSRTPLSSQLAAAVRRKLQEARQGIYEGPEMKAAEPVLGLQAQWSLIPDANDLLIESTRTGEGFHHFIFPFAGRLVHEGLAALTAHRLSQWQPMSIIFSMNDYGFMLTTPQEWSLDEAGWLRILSPDNLLEDIAGCLNTTELAKRHFREISRIAGLIFQGYPGQQKKVRQVQASSSLFYDVFRRYDPDNLLLYQAHREVMQQQLETTRLLATLRQTTSSQVRLSATRHLTPLSFPLWAGFIQGRATSENWADRVRRMAEQLESDRDE